MSIKNKVFFLVEKFKKIELLALSSQQLPRLQFSLLIPILFNKYQ